ncbi:hypothetical protein [Virgibacillus halodenitrificans]|uniref:hypothetical protein n=1 Tax=Virgibacillus halodenitrificans TaxID=1482 RepID=UPI00045D4267|nr:hypothetical protein [Virgibacillus halodenitrificans]MCG1028444.1 hypothetical protein [Virgibacillus halodenitrificans]CDQ32519.1 hypothetical protein BN993_01935 [Virgibacillus halodenitrificans]
MDQNEDFDYELDKWDVILPIVFIISLALACAVIGFLVYGMIEENIKHFEAAIYLKQSNYLLE